MVWWMGGSFKFVRIPVSSVWRIEVGECWRMIRFSAQGVEARKVQSLLLERQVHEYAHVYNCAYERRLYCVSILCVCARTLRLLNANMTCPRW